MMIDPETYYVMHLKGGSQQQILAEIRSLKREINRLKREIEDPDLNPYDIAPSRDVQLAMNMEYLERAIQAYEAAGGEYKPTKAELRIREFDESLKDINQVTFTIGGFFGGFDKRTCTVSGDQVIIHKEHFPEPDPADQPVDEICPKEEFIDGLRQIHIGEWKKDYTDQHVLDGTSWNLEIRFDGGRRAVVKSGRNAYPYNFEVLTDLFDSF